MKTRDEAFSLLCSYTKTSSLIKHALAVEAAMRWYAGHFKVDQSEADLWGIAGLLHDFDYEQFPDPTPPDGHPYAGDRILAELGYPDQVRNAIMGHALYTNTPRTTLMAKTLFAVDELTGFVIASTLVRPDKSLSTLEAASVKKKMKDKAFAKGCNREEIKLGAEELGVELETHIDNVIRAMRTISTELGL